MNSAHNIRSAAKNQDSNATEETTTQPMMPQPPAGSSRTKELRSHQGITIKWSLDSATRRRIDMRPAAADGAAAPVTSTTPAGAGGASC
jgi:hypothetical protein